jgi:hypothetical protein
VGEFFSTIPEVFSGLWEFLGESRGSPWQGVAVIIGSGILLAVCLGAAMKLRDSFGWTSAIFGMMGATIAAWWLFGVIPSAWIYFADGQRDLMEGTIIPGEVGFGTRVIASNFYQVFRDLVATVIYGIALGVFVIAAIWIQKHFPKALAEGEEPRPQSGGYK